MSGVGEQLRKVQASPLVSGALLSTLDDLVSLLKQPSGAAVNPYQDVFGEAAHSAGVLAGIHAAITVIEAHLDLHRASVDVMTDSLMGGLLGAQAPAGHPTEGIESNSIQPTKGPTS